MQEVIQDIERWRGEGQAVGLATVVQTWGSAPRKAGAKMAMTPEGQISGSVSGGCVEGAVFDETTAALEADQAKLLSFGVADETAWEVGLACGGSIRVFVEPLREAIYTRTQELIQAEIATVVGTIIAGPFTGQKLLLTSQGERMGQIDASLEEAVVAALDAGIANGRSQAVQLAGENELFVDVYLPPPTLIMVGGVHIAVALTGIAKVLGYRTIVVDPRRAFGSDERFPHVDQLIQQWPDKAFGDLIVNEATAIALLTHDPKIDDPALKQVLDSPAFYIGALGSSKTHAKRKGRLAEYGYSEVQISKIYGPIGLNINAQTPEEIAVAIMGQIIAARRGA